MACWTLFRLVDGFVHEHGLGITGMAPTDLEYSPIRMVQPDVFVLPTHAGKLPTDWHRLPELLLAVEVLSPSTARHDRVTKREMHLVEGLPPYWVVDLHARESGAIEWAAFGRALPLHRSDSPIPS